GGELRGTLAYVVERPLAREKVERGERGGARERVPGVGVAVEEGRQRLVGREEGGEDLLARERRGEGPIAPGDSLADAQEVGGDLGLRAGEHRPGASESGRDLVRDQESPGFACHGRNARRYSGGCIHIPAAPWTSGSTMVAARSRACVPSLARASSS